MLAHLGQQNGAGVPQSNASVFSRFCGEPKGGGGMVPSTSQLSAVRISGPGALESKVQFKGVARVQG